MDVKFKTQKLQKQYEEHKKAQRAYGKEVANRFIQRINLLKQVKNLDEACLLPGLNCHKLKGNRQGQWAIKLNGFYRLIFTVEGKKLNIACIEEVSKHYDQ